MHYSCGHNKCLVRWSTILVTIFHQAWKYLATLVSCDSQCYNDNQKSMSHACTEVNTSRQLARSGQKLFRQTTADDMLGLIRILHNLYTVFRQGYKGTVIQRCKKWFCLSALGPLKIRSLGKNTNILILELDATVYSCKEMLKHSCE